MKTLSDTHRAELHASGLSDETIEAAGIYTGDRECKDIVGFLPKGWGSWGECIVYPFHDLDGDPIEYCQIKPPKPYCNDKGKEAKYVSPLDEEHRAYFPPGAKALLQGNQPVIWTEGAKKVLSAVQRGFACFGLTGVWNWQQHRLTTSTGKKYGKKKLIPDIDSIDWGRRDVLICFDSDAAEKRGVRLAEAQFAEAIKEKGATVRIVRIPSIGNGKTGLDDFLVHHGENGPAELQKLIDAAKEPEPLPKLTAMDMADILLEEFYTRPAGLLLRWQRDEFFAYEKNRYRIVPASDLTLIAMRQLDALCLDSGPYTAAQVVKCMASRCLVGHAIEPPVYLKSPNWDTSLWVSTEGGIIDLRFLLNGHPVVPMNHTPDWFSLNCLPFTYCSEADCPKFRAFLEQVMEGDEDRIAILQEWAGYCLVPDISQHKFLICEGDGANGKSVWLKVLRALIGADNCSHVPLESFGQRFQLWPTVGKLANIIAEVGDLAKPDEALFKAYVGGDTVQVDRKSLSILNVTPTARITISTNTRPRWMDRSDGIWRRMLLVPFRVQIPEERQDKRLADFIINNELPGVFNWAVQGLRALRLRGHFPDAAVCSEAIADYRNEVNPAATFLAEECKEKPGATVQSRWLYAAYSQWCRERNYRPLGDRHFGQEVRRLYRHAERVQDTVMDIDGTSRRVWCLIGVASEAADRAERDAEEKRSLELMRISEAELRCRKAAVVSAGDN